MDRESLWHHRGRGAVVLLPEKHLHLRAHFLYFGGYLRYVDGDLLVRGVVVPLHNAHSKKVECQVFGCTDHSIVCRLGYSRQCRERHRTTT